MRSNTHSILITRFPYESILSGEEWHTINLAQSLVSRGHHVAFMGSCQVLLSMFSKEQIPTYKVWGGTLPVTKKSLLFFLLLWPVIAINLWRQSLRILRRENINRVYMLSLTEKVLLTPLFLLMGIPVIWVEHQRIGRWLTLNPLRPFYTLLSRWVRIIGVSPDHVQSLEKIGIFTPHLQLITNGIDTTLFSPSLTPLFPKRETIFRIGTVARLYEDKGIHILIQSIAQLPSILKKQIELNILGEGPEKERLETLAHTLGLQEQVHFLRPYIDVAREDTPRFMKSLDLFVLPSTQHDPFGLVVAESMATQTPVLLTDVCGISTFLTHGHDAFIVEHNNIQKMTAGLEAMLINNDMRTLIAHNGLQTCLEKFTLERMVNEYEAVFM